MDDSSSDFLLLIAGLLALHAAIVLAHQALNHSRISQLRERAEANHPGAKQVLRLLEHPHHLNITTGLALAVIKFGLTLLILFSIVVSLPYLTDQNAVITIVGGLLVAGVCVYVLAELLPGAFGRAYADDLAPRLVLLPRILGTILSPIVAVLVRVYSFSTRPRSDDDDEAKSALEEEIIGLVESGEGEEAFEDEERAMIRSVLEFDETMVREIMVPRPDITAVEVDESLREALRLFIESGHSRIPVYEGEIDDIKGVLYAKDLLAVWYGGYEAQSSIRALMRPPHFVPETKKAEDLFRELQHSNVHLAVVVDEYGSTAGVITVEDIVEEIVGDIRDEYDATETMEFVQVADHEFTVDASINLYDLNERLDANLPAGDSDTLGGHLYNHFGRVPEIGERLEANGLAMRIVSVEGVRIRTVHITRLNPSIGQETENTDTTSVRNELQPRPSET